MPSHPPEALTYRAAGVDIEAADRIVEKIRAVAQRTHGPQVVPGLDAFAGLFRLGAPGPTLAASCDGVGTKLLVARALGRYRGLGQDLVAMNVNDLLPSGARPLFFLDYVAAGRLEEAAILELVEGMAAACLEAGCALLGGETAEMPDVYRPGELDLAGFAVGLVRPGHAPDASALAPGDRVLALPSTGVHASGLSLARRALERAGLGLAQPVPGLPGSLGEALLEPTPIYVAAVLQALAVAAGEVRAAAHVTGGGLLGRAARLLPPSGSKQGAALGLRIDAAAYRRPPIFDAIAQAGAVAADEMARTFNMGLGFLLVVAPAGAERILSAPATPWRAVGEVVAGGPRVDLGYARAA